MFAERILHGLIRLNGASYPEDANASPIVIPSLIGAFLWKFDVWTRPRPLPQPGKEAIYSQAVQGKGCFGISMPFQGILHDFGNPTASGGPRTACPAALVRR